MGYHIENDLIKQQNKMKKNVITVDTPIDLLKNIKYIAGVDISWINETNGISDNKGIATMVILKYSTMKILYQDSIEIISDIPYISGYLGFREIPHYLQLWERLKNTSSITPDLIIVDGFGILHPRGAGSASMLGIMLDIPTIGIGKTINLGGCQYSDKKIKTKLIDDNLLEIPLINNGKITGIAIRKTLTHRQPIYVSIGYKISLETASTVIRNCMINKIPEPIRQADLISREYIRSKKIIKKSI